jgi:phospholipase C
MKTVLEHIVVLCLENRSFDHMLGYLDHPDPSFRGLLHGGPYDNPRSNGERVATSPDAKNVLPFGPDHSHNAVMHQIGLRGRDRGEPTHQGFVTSFERKVSGRSPTSRGGVLPWLQKLLHREPQGAPDAFARGPLVMLCHEPDHVPVLSALARSFAVCDNWYCSVPGETWPNRNYLHAATSDGETNIEIRAYCNPTIFELLEGHLPAAGVSDGNARDWRIYHDGLAQALAFPNLWDRPERHARWYPLQDFSTHVTSGDLPAYSFIEPRHQPPLLPLDRHGPPADPSEQSDSQHPENGLVSDDAYDSWPATADSDFARGERLIASIYESLRAQPDLFARTALVITYDEHGGLYDHQPATVRVEDPGRLPRSRLGTILHAITHANAKPFDFTRVGVRVPAVIVSPLIPAGVVEHRFMEHASVPATVRAVFAPKAPALGPRDRKAATFHDLLSLDAPRTDLPDLSSHATWTRAASPAAVGPRTTDRASDAAETWTPDYYREFLRQGEQARKRLAKVGETEMHQQRPVRSRQAADEFSASFHRAAERHRREQRSGDRPQGRGQ